MAFRSPRSYRKFAFGPRRRALFKRRFARRNFRTGGFLGVELKFLDEKVDWGDAGTLRYLDAATAEIDPPTPDCLNALSEGSGVSQRIGRKVTNKMITIRGAVVWPAISFDAAVDFVANPNAVIFLVLDTQTNGAQLNSEDVFTAFTAFADHQVMTNVFRDQERVARFRVLAKVTLCCPNRNMGQDVAGGKNVYERVYVPFEINKKLNFETTYNATATPATVSQIVDNSLHMIGYCDGIGIPGTAPVLSSQPRLVYASRLRYVG